MSQDPVNAIGEAQALESPTAASGSGRGRSGGAARDGPRAARSERGRQDDDGPHPGHPAAPGCRAGVGGRLRRRARAGRGPSRHQPDRPERRDRRVADGRGEPSDDGPAHRHDGRAVRPAGRGSARPFRSRSGRRRAGCRRTPAVCGGGSTWRAGLVGRPSVLFLDEPTTGLDLPSRQAMWQVIARPGPHRGQRAADHPVPRGGRSAGRPDRRDRRRASSWRGFTRRAEESDRRPAARSSRCATRRHSTRSVDLLGARLINSDPVRRTVSVRDRRHGGRHPRGAGRGRSARGRVDHQVRRAHGNPRRRVPGPDRHAPPSLPPRARRSGPCLSHWWQTLPHRFPTSSHTGSPATLLSDAMTMVGRSLRLSRRNLEVLTDLADAARHPDADVRLPVRWCDRHRHRVRVRTSCPEFWCCARVSARRAPRSASARTCTAGSWIGSGRWTSTAPHVLVRPCRGQPGPEHGVDRPGVRGRVPDRIPLRRRTARAGSRPAGSCCCSSSPSPGWPRWSDCWPDLRRRPTVSPSS